MWRCNVEEGTWDFETGTGADTWSPATHAVAIDAGMNELDRVPAADHRDLEERYQRQIDAGQVHVVSACELTTAEQYAALQHRDAFYWRCAQCERDLRDYKFFAELPPADTVCDACRAAEFAGR